MTAVNKNRFPPVAYLPCSLTIFMFIAKVYRSDTPSALILFAKLFVYCYEAKLIYWLGIYKYIFFPSKINVGWYIKLAYTVVT